MIVWVHAYQPAAVPPRLAAFAGLSSLLPLVLLGVAWPSVATILSVVTLPACFILALGVWRARLIQRPGIRAYCLACVTASALMWILTLA